MIAMLLSTKDAAARLGISDRAVRKHIASGALPATLIGRSHVIDEADLAKFKPAPVGWKPGRSRKITPA